MAYAVCVYPETRLKMLISSVSYVLSDLLKRSSHYLVKFTLCILSSIFLTVLFHTW
jgi:hypothetical protein